MELHRVRSVLLMALMLLLASWAGQHYSASASAQANQTWEYQIVKLDRIDRSAGGAFEVKGLNKLGEAGWEAVGINDSWVLMKHRK